MKRKVVVTGTGVVSPIGNDSQTYWDALIAGKCGIGLITKFDVSEYRSKIAGEVKNLDPGEALTPRQKRRADPFVQFALVAAYEAIKNCKINLEKVNRERIGVIVGSGIGGIKEIEEQLAILASHGPRRISPFFVTKMITNIAAGKIAIIYGLKGPNLSISTACATSNHAIGEAFRIIQRGEADIMIAGGSEAAISPLSLAGFCAIQALSQNNDAPEKASRPFDANRDGFIMAEGSALLILESEEHAVKRDAPILAELVGYGNTSDAFHETAPAERGEGARRAMALAIKDAGLTPQEIEHINAHGTSTKLNDKAETEAVKDLMGDYAYKVPITANKSITGHLLGATSALEAISSIFTIRNSIIPPTINYETPDPDCDLDYVPNIKREKSINTVMTNSFGFGGHNGVLVFKKWEG